VAGVAGAAEVWDALSRVSDPEYPLSIVDMGMVYAVRVDPEGVAQVDITFTSIGCPAMDMICSDVHESVSAVPGVTEVRVEVVWSPPWNKDRITERGRKVLQVYGVVN
jgi:phenylacetate-CoA oxygenase PaaJ subunit